MTPYEKLLKRYERKYTPIIYNALKEQIDEYLKTRQIEQIKSEPIFKAIDKLYNEVGKVWAYKTEKDARRQLKLPKIGVGFGPRITRLIRNNYGQDILNMSENISQTTKDKIRKILQDAATNNLTLNQVTEQIRDAGVSETRARVIARTETGRAANATAIANMDAQGFAYQKKWFSLNDNRTRLDHSDAHGKLDGQVRNQGEAFSVVDKDNITQRMQFPGDVSLGANPAETINCRCSMQFFLQGKGEKLPEKPEEKPIEPKPITDKINADTIEEAKQISERLFSKVGGIKIKNVYFHPNLSLETANLLNNQLSNLLNEYTPFTYPDSITELKFSSDPRFYGVVVKSPRGQLLTANFGHQNGGFSPAENRAYFRELSENIKLLKLSEFAHIDEGNAKISTLTHEFAHVLTTTSKKKINLGEQDRAFWSEIRSLKIKYTRDVNEAYKNRDEAKLDQIYLGNYASTNINEFMAEGFTEYKLSSTPSPYAVQIGKIIDKYFKNASR